MIVPFADMLNHEPGVSGIADFGYNADVDGFALMSKNGVSGNPIP